MSDDCGFVSNIIVFVALRWVGLYRIEPHFQLGGNEWLWESCQIDRFKASGSSLLGELIIIGVDG